MGVFVVKGKKGAASTPRELEALVVGARSTCGLSLEDPLVAEVHCAFSALPAGGYVVEDLDSSTGTYVNGVAAAGKVALKDGDEVVVGVSRLKVGLVADKPELTLTVKEADFHFDKKEDPLRWSRDETEFGRFKPVRYGNYAAIVLLLLALPFCLVGASREAVMDFGPLADVHRASDPRFAAAVAHAGADAEGCAACHDPWKGATVGKCAACHPEVMAADRHPFRPNPEGWDKGCAPCHLEHQGGSAASLRGAAADDGCGGCHAPELQAAIDGGTVDVAATGLRLAARRAAAGGGAPARPFVVDVAYDTFSHADHLKAGVRCADCHERADVATAGGARSPRREFRTSTYESCAKCHDPATASHPRAPADPAKRFPVAWHGTDDGGKNCLACHDATHRKDLRTSVVADRDLGFVARTRTHGPEFEACRGGNDDCSKCHVNGPPPERAPARPRPFRHGTHCATPAAGAAGGFAASAACLKCHDEQRTSDALAKTVTEGVYRGPGAASCAPCHGAEGSPSHPRVATPDAAGPAPRRRVEFPHARHLGLLAGGKASPSLAAGCVACHPYAAGADGPAAAVVGTDPRAADCTACHQTHREIGGGSCAKCHLAGDPAYAFDPKAAGVASPVVKNWPAPTGFSHWSPGHAPDAEAGRCDACHRGPAGAEGAATLAALRLPDENDPSCRDCHIAKRARFHWR